MLDEKLKEMREEENKSIGRGRKLVGSFVIINIVVTLLTWILSIYSWYIALISIAISLLIYFLSVTKFIWMINSLYRSYWYLAIVFSMMNQELELLLLLICVFIIAFDIYSSITLIFSKDCDNYLYEIKSRK